MNLALAAVAVAGLTAGALGILIVIVALVLAVMALLVAWFRSRHELKLHRVKDNPILEPVATHWWESQAVFNPAAFVHGGRVHLLYRALGNDGISRIGYASSVDGVHFERHPEPAYESMPGSLPDPRVLGKLSYETITYNAGLYASGGGWGGSEDPRAVVIDDVLYMTFTSFENWSSERMMLTSLPMDRLADKNFMWSKGVPLSPQGEVNKNWLLFPEKIQGRFAILSSISPKIEIHYIDDPAHLEEKPIRSKYDRQGRPGQWDNQVRGAGAPPLKTKYGWLLFYHGFDAAHPEVAYKVGAMLLDLNDPTRVLYRSSAPVLEASEWYENDWKAGVTYTSGAVIVGGELFVYYGGGDKRIAAAKVNLEHFLQRLMRPENKQ